MQFPPVRQPRSGSFLFSSLDLRRVATSTYFFFVRLTCACELFTTKGVANGESVKTIKDPAEEAGPSI
jgi:hypothetical protein